MVNLKTAPRPAKDATLCCPQPEEPAYPYGLALSLDDETLRKLGFAALPEAGSEVVFTARATVTGASQYEEVEAGKASAPRISRSVSLQITDMDLGGERKSAAEALYG